MPERIQNLHTKEIKKNLLVIGRKNDPFSIKCLIIQNTGTITYPATFPKNSS
jgi:hypothetical protein